MGDEVAWYNVTVNAAGTPTLEGKYGLADHYATIEATAEALQLATDNSRDMDVAYLVICGALVFFMQAGFAMLEVGIVQKKNSTNILFKNMIDASLAAMCFWLLGYGFAYGTDAGGFIGTDNFALSGIYNNAGEGGSDGWEGWFFQWAFTGAAATIVAGSVCERTKIEAYFIYSIVLTVFIYPIVVHWGWGSGFLSAWGAATGPLFSKNDSSNGMIDFAGSGVVHMVGGFSGLMGAIVVGPRRGRFDPTTGALSSTWYQGDKVLQSLGAFILWFGWYGFNCGSTLMISANAANVAGKAAVTTTLAATAGALGATFLSKMISGNYDVSMGLNGILAGLVSITANCSVVNPWHAVLIGLVGSVILFGGSKLIIKLKIDDPCDACVVHGFCGFWGLLATGIFCIDENVQYAAYPNVNDACKRGEQFGVQFVGGLVIIVWTTVTAGLTFVAVNAAVGMNVGEEMEDLGLDASEHGLAQESPPPKQMVTVPPAQQSQVPVPPIPQAADNDYDLGSA